MAGKIQFVPPPNDLRKKVGGNLKQIDAKAIEKANKALSDMQGEFETWLRNDLKELIGLYKKTKEKGANGDGLRALMIKAHDMKGTGTTYNYPLVSRIAASLHWLTEITESPNMLSLPLVEMHIKAMQAIVSNKITTVDDPMGTKLAEELEATVHGLFLKSEQENKQAAQA